MTLPPGVSGDGRRAVQAHNRRPAARSPGDKVGIIGSGDEPVTPQIRLVGHGAGVTNGSAVVVGSAARTQQGAQVADLIEVPQLRLPGGTDGHKQLSSDRQTAVTGGTVLCGILPRVRTCAKRRCHRSSAVQRAVPMFWESTLHSPLAATIQIGRDQVAGLHNLYPS